MGVDASSLTISSGIKLVLGGVALTVARSPKEITVIVEKSSPPSIAAHQIVVFTNSNNAVMTIPSPPEVPFITICGLMPGRLPPFNMTIHGARIAAATFSFYSQDRGIIVFGKAGRKAATPDDFGCRAFVPSRRLLDDRHLRGPRIDGKERVELVWRRDLATSPLKHRTPRQFARFRRLPRRRVAEGT